MLIVNLSVQYHRDYSLAGDIVVMYLSEASKTEPEAPDTAVTVTIATKLKEAPTSRHGINMSPSILLTGAHWAQRRRDSTPLILNIRYEIFILIFIS